MYNQSPPPNQYNPQQPMYAQQPPQQPIMYAPQPPQPPQPQIVQYVQPVEMVHVSPPMNDPLVDGLSYFPALVVKQKMNSFWEYMCNCEEENKYQIFNPMGHTKEKILVAKEKSGYCTRMCLAEKRHFHMAIKTNEDQEALYFERPYRIFERGGWCCCCSKCGFQGLRVYGGADSKAAEQLIAYVREDYYLIFPSLTIYDEHDELCYRIQLKKTCGSCCCRFAKASFEIFDASDKECKHPVGKIKKKWSGTMKEIFTDADNFFIEFPPASTARQRAGLLGALFLIDYLYYEDGGCHILQYLGAPISGPCACLAWCGSLTECLCETACDSS